MKLSVIERVLLGGILSSYKGSFINLKLVREGRELISFNNDELVKLNIVEGDGKVSWNPTAAGEIGEVEMPFSSTFVDIVRKLLLSLNDSEKLTEHHISLYEKFIV